MKNVQLGMNVDKQRRKIEHLLAEADTLQKRIYLTNLLGRFEAAVQAAQPQPASQFIPMYEEEFG